MARTFAAVTPNAENQSKGQQREVIRDVVISSYTTGGEALAPADFGLSKFLFVDVQRDDTGRGGSYDYTNQKLIAWVSAGTQVTSTTALTLRVRALGV